MTMALHTSANDLAFEDIESSEQRRCAMTLVVVGHRAGSAFLHRQAGLGAVQRLDLRFFIDRENAIRDIQSDARAAERYLRIGTGIQTRPLGHH